MTRHDKNADAQITPQNANDGILDEDELSAIAGGLYTYYEIHVHGSFPQQICASGSTHSTLEQQARCPDLNGGV